MKRVSQKEAENGLVFIHPLKLKDFPKAGEEFAIKFSKGEEKTRIQEVRCNCTDAPKEHAHHYLTIKGFKMNKGDVVQIKKTEGKYLIE